MDARMDAPMPHFQRMHHMHHLISVQTMVQRMRAAQEAMESETKEEEFYLKALLGWVIRDLGRSRTR
eukprot:scaffold11704_cov20-Tisochrysis_lutea.AAC.2